MSKISSASISQSCCKEKNYQIKKILMGINPVMVKKFYIIKYIHLMDGGLFNKIIPIKANERVFSLVPKPQNKLINAQKLQTIRADKFA